MQVLSGRPLESSFLLVRRFAGVATGLVTVQPVPTKRLDRASDRRQGWCQIDEVGITRILQDRIGDRRLGMLRIDVAMFLRCSADKKKSAASVVLMVAA